MGKDLKVAEVGGTVFLGALNSDMNVHYKLREDGILELPNSFLNLDKQKILYVISNLRTVLDFQLGK